VAHGRATAARASRRHRRRPLQQPQVLVNDALRRLSCEEHTIAGRRERQARDVLWIAETFDDSTVLSNQATASHIGHLYFACTN
jgi:hypothetical protein